MSAQISYDKTPIYTVKEVAEMTGLSTYTVRYYENSGLIPGVDRTGGNIRMFSDYNLGWLRLVHCLRATGLSIDRILHYIRLCFEGDATIPERAELFLSRKKSCATSSTPSISKWRCCNTRSNTMSSF